jgi:hypothetical protein
MEAELSQKTARVGADSFNYNSSQSLSDKQDLCLFVIRVIAVFLYDLFVM